MSHQMTLQPMRVLIDGFDSEGRLILADGQLAAVIVRLDAEHHTTSLRGKWHLEAGFGKCAVVPADAGTWDTPEDALAWIEEGLSGRTHTRGDFA
jgi:hypothetical protein